MKRKKTCKFSPDVDFHPTTDKVKGTLIKLQDFENEGILQIVKTGTELKI